MHDKNYILPEIWNILEIQKITKMYDIIGIVVQQIVTIFYIVLLE